MRRLFDPKACEKAECPRNKRQRASRGSLLPQRGSLWLVVKAPSGEQALAEPGGICVSRVVRDQVRDKLDFAFEDMGEQQVKNIARPVRVYRVGSAATPEQPAVQDVAEAVVRILRAPATSQLYQLAGPRV